MSFIKESMKEFDHIVWPTPAETKKYFVTVVSMIAVLTVFLFVVGTLFSAGLFAIKRQVTPVQTTTTTAPSAQSGDLKLDNLKTTPTPTTPAKK